MAWDRSGGEPAEEHRWELEASTGVWAARAIRIRARDCLFDSVLTFISRLRGSSYAVRVVYLLFPLCTILFPSYVLIGLCLRMQGDTFHCLVSSGFVSVVVWPVYPAWFGPVLAWFGLVRWIPIIVSSTDRIFGVENL